MKKRTVWIRCLAVAAACSLSAPSASHAGINQGFIPSIASPNEVPNPKVDDLIEVAVRVSNTTEVNQTRFLVRYDPLLFDRQFAGSFRFPTAGFFNGIIRVRGGDRFTWQLSRILHHELVHAALHMVTPSAIYPGWLNEGLAEWFEARSHEKAHLDSRELMALVRARDEGRLFSFQQLAAPSFVRMYTEEARIAYLQSYGMIEYLARRKGERVLREFCREVVRTGNLDRSMRRVYRADLDDLEAAFISDLG